MLDFVWTLKWSSSQLSGIVKKKKNSACMHMFGSIFSLISSSYFWSVPKTPFSSPEAAIVLVCAMNRLDSWRRPEGSRTLGTSVCFDRNKQRICAERPEVRDSVARPEFASLVLTERKEGSEDKIDKTRIKRL